MKKYILAVVIILGIGVTAFGYQSYNQHASNKKQIYRQRFCMLLNCASQVGTRSQVFDANNYTQTLCPNTECDGATCVCAIYAEANGTSGKPIIDNVYDPTLYAQLYDFASDGIWDNPHGLVELKEE